MGVSHPSPAAQATMKLLAVVLFALLASAFSSPPPLPPIDRDFVDDVAMEDPVGPWGGEPEDPVGPFDGEPEDPFSPFGAEPEPLDGPIDSDPEPLDEYDELDESVETDPEIIDDFEEAIHEPLDGGVF